MGGLIVLTVCKLRELMGNCIVQFVKDFAAPLACKQLTPSVPPNTQKVAAWQL